MQAARNKTAPQRVSEILKASILASEDGAFLGTEEQLSTQLGVSIPTLRQAARLLQHEQVLTVKRGTSGGYFGRRPSMDVAVNTAGFFLATRGVSIDESTAVSRGLLQLAVTRAVACENPVLRARLKQLIDNWDAGHAMLPRTGYMSTWLEVIIDMGDSVPLKLFFAILSDYAAITQSRPVNIALAETEWARRSLELLQAIYDREEARALELLDIRLDLLARVVKATLPPMAGTA